MWARSLAPGDGRSIMRRAKAGGKADAVASSEGETDLAEDESKVPGIGLDDAIEALRADLIVAMETGAGKPIQFPVEKMTVELHVVATKSVNGKAGFKVPIVEVELGGGGGWSSENTQKVTVEFGSPVDQDGIPVRVARRSGEKP